ncbi:MAG TPA: hypothetical protein VFY59_07015 [Rubrobacter sp.]|nr:hypothetical protein [Rubrobacter sp.]
MPDDGRFSDEELEQRLRDLGARMEYPPTPDVAGTVRRELDEEARSTRPRRSLGWPPFLTPRWTAAAAALLVICAFALSPTLRSTLSSPFTTGFQAGPEAGSAAKPEGNASGDRYKQEEAAGAPAADQGEAARACSPPFIEAVPASAAAGEKFRLRSQGLSPGCDENTPSREVGILFQQNNKTWSLTTLTADSDAAFEARLRVPAGAEPGPAKVQAVFPSGKRAEERLTVLP